MKNEVMLGIGTAMSIMTEFLFGGFTIELRVLFAFMVIDILTGVIAARYGSSNKTSSGKLSSDAMWRGLVKKIATLCLCSTAHLCDYMLGINYCMNACMYAFCANELLSILENYTVTVTNPPAIFEKVLDILKKED